MMSIAPALLFALFVWWFSTGAILFLDGLPRRTFRWTLAGATALAGAALYGLFVSRGDASTGGAYLAFTCALAVWGWHELTFLMGLVTGPRKAPCPPRATGWRRFGYATLAVIHHEVALAATLVGIAGLTWGAPNQVGTWTFLVLWVMRLSAKLNVFLGVRNLAEEFIPEHLQYLRTYFRRAPLNPLLPVSILVGGAVVVRLTGHALADGASAFCTVSMTLVATMLGLAVLEHMFLALPMGETALWRWALRARTR